MLKKIIFSSLCLLCLGCNDVSSDNTTSDNDKTKPTTNAASESTIKSNDTVLEYLPFENKNDYADAEKGFKVTAENPKIKGDNTGNVVYNIDKFDFIQGDAPDTVNPSLWRQGELIGKNGLFKVVDGIYQVRGFDLANMSFIRGKTGWIVIDVLTATETARAALKLLQDNVADLPVSAVIITHSHVDHYGGIKGILPDNNESRNIPVIAPQGFVEAAVNENVMAGNQMKRRSTYMYGNLLDSDATGTVGSGLGTTTALGNVNIPQPTREISSSKEIIMVDGIEMEFYYTPGAEAPAELMVYIPEFSALMQAEEMSKTLHNLYTLRGAQVRNALLWSKYLQDTIVRFGDDVKVSFGTHHWPTWGNEEIVEFWKGQRDIYRYIHDETLRLANHGQTLIEVGENVKLPDSLAKQFSNRDYYGTVNHNAKAQYQLYYGWFSGNPSELNELPPVEEGIKFVEYMGGADVVIAKAQKDYDKGEYRWVATALNHVVFAEPDNIKAKELLANTLEQLGYQAESGPWRNFYLTGAYELRNGTDKAKAAFASAKSEIDQLDMETYLDYLAIRLNHPEAAKTFLQLNFIIPDDTKPSGITQKFGLIVENGVINYALGTLLDAPQATITLNRSLINETDFDKEKIKTAMEKGEITIDGNTEKFVEFSSLIDTFSPAFNIVTP